jgi:hypothetical protein
LYISDTDISCVFNQDTIGNVESISIKHRFLRKNG